VLERPSMGYDGYKNGPDYQRYLRMNIKRKEMQKVKRISNIVVTFWIAIFALVVFLMTNLF
jgi:hypothetical protein